MSADAPILELRRIVKTYGTEQNPVEVLRGIDLSVLAGEYVAIVGPSGSGKSTLLNILGALDRPTAGQYLLAGEDVASFDDRKLSLVRNTRIGFVFQSFHLISHLTVLENVQLPLFYARLPRAERVERCKQLLEHVGLGHRASHIPAELSGGERQRAAIARALSNEPAMLLADEPTGNLDTKTSEEIMGLLAKLHDQGSTIVMITHDTEIAAAAPRRVMLRDGLIESDDGTPELHVAGTARAAS